MAFEHSLTPDDFTLLLNCLPILAKRGAFNITEYADIVPLYEKMISIARKHPKLFQFEEATSDEDEDEEEGVCDSCEDDEEFADATADIADDELVQLALEVEESDRAKAGENESGSDDEEDADIALAQSNEIIRSKSPKVIQSKTKIKRDSKGKHK